ncbi:MAG TPA: cation:dicarboxylase symporter family transporter [Bacteroidales bacterium]|nr:cation:dicarboxylase symporter family transporter [Bacteroidales bacterium]HPS50567.1 cation:dicarboxylase symporter family transporter [Bacteroidales bacterium]
MFTSRRLLTALFVTLTLAVTVHLADRFGIFDAPGWLLITLRWIPIICYFLFAWHKKKLTTWIFVSMVAGAEFGHDLPLIARELNIVSQIFIRMVKTIIAPLLFGTLVTGIAGHANLKQVGRMGWKSLVYFEVVSTIALFIGLAAINISKAGMGVTVPAEMTHGALPQVQAQSWRDIVLHVFPENIAKSIAEGQVLQIVVFSILFGIALAMVKEQYRAPMLRFTDSLTTVMFKFTNMIMLFAPFAVFAAIAYSVGHMGLGVLVNLFELLGTLYIALFVFLAGVLLPIMLALRIPLRPFIRAVGEPATIAFATTSSESALPLAMENMERFGVPRKIVSFVIPTGYSFNLDGTTLYLAMASIFVANMAGIHLSFGTQIIMMITLMLTSKGVAGVPRASLVILLGTATSFGLPVWPIFIILGIDELMDMARTATNVIGNCLATVVIAWWEKEWVPSKINGNKEPA